MTAAARIAPTETPSDPETTIFAPPAAAKPDRRFVLGSVQREGRSFVRALGRLLERLFGRARNLHMTRFCGESQSSIIARCGAKVAPAIARARLQVYEAGLFDWRPLKHQRRFDALFTLDV